MQSRICFLVDGFDWMPDQVRHDGKRCGCRVAGCELRVPGYGLRVSGCAFTPLSSRPSKARAGIQSMLDAFSSFDISLEAYPFGGRAGIHGWFRLTALTGCRIKSGMTGRGAGVGLRDTGSGFRVMRFALCHPGQVKREPGSRFCYVNRLLLDPG